MTREATEPRLLSIKQLMEYTGLGRHSADRLGQAAQAKIRQGKNVRYDRLRIDQHIDAMGR